MVIVVREQLRSNAKSANEKLKKAHEKLEELAHIDPLTTALNRHAFHGYLKRNGTATKSVSGCVGFFDIDDLKEINDNYGHGVGDVAIRVAVKAMRDVIRPEDLIFRWGGDEFFVIMIGLDADAAYRRMEKFEKMLTNVAVEGADKFLTIGVSHAFENFEDLAELENTIAKADAMMYLNKQQRKAGNKSSTVSPFSPSGIETLAHR